MRAPYSAMRVTGERDSGSSVESGRMSERGIINPGYLSCARTTARSGITGALAGGQHSEGDPCRSRRPRYGVSFTLRASAAGPLADGRLLGADRAIRTLLTLTAGTCFGKQQLPPRLAIAQQPVSTLLKTAAPDPPGSTRPLSSGVADHRYRLRLYAEPKQLVRHGLGVDGQHGSASLKNVPALRGTHSVGRAEISGASRYS